MAELQVWDTSLAEELAAAARQSSLDEQSSYHSKAMTPPPPPPPAAAPLPPPPPPPPSTSTTTTTTTTDRPCQNIAGCDVYFPPGHRPFPPQLAVMSKAITALRRSQAALLESPTGTGKTLALLCSALAWQRPFRKAAFEAEIAAQQAKHRAPSSRALKLEYEEQPNAGNSTKKVDGKSKKAAAAVVVPRVPQIFFCSRTHSQLSQAAAELKRCPREYLDDFGGLRMTILASRKHSCTHAMAAHSRNIDDDCRKLRAENRLLRGARRRNGADEDGGAGLLLGAADGTDRNAVKMAGGGGGGGGGGKCGSGGQQGGQQAGGSKVCGCPQEGRSFVVRGALPAVWDVEDLVATGRRVGGCGYYASHEAAPKAHLILCPYNYLVDPSIRRALDLKLHDKETVVIFDEAHNIEGVARDAASAELSVEALAAAAAELRAIARALDRRAVHGSISGTGAAGSTSSTSGGGGGGDRRGGDAERGQDGGEGSDGNVASMKRDEGTSHGPDAANDRNAGGVSEDGKSPTKEECERAEEAAEGCRAARALAATTEAVVQWALADNGSRRWTASGSISSNSGSGGGGSGNGGNGGFKRRNGSSNSPASKAVAQEVEEHCVESGEEAVAGLQQYLEQAPGAVPLVEFDKLDDDFPFDQLDGTACSDHATTPDNNSGGEGGVGTQPMTQYEEFNPKLRIESEGSSGSSNASSKPLGERLDALLQAVTKGVEANLQQSRGGKRGSASRRGRRQAPSSSSEATVDGGSGTAAAAAASEEEEVELSKPSRAVLSSLVTVLGFMVSDGLSNLPAYRAVLKRQTTRPPPVPASGGAVGNIAHGGGARVGGGRHAVTTVCLWCLGGAVAFRPLRDACRSLLLTSGTLSPLGSFAHELGLSEGSHSANATGSSSSSSSSGSGTVDALSRQVKGKEQRQQLAPLRLEAGHVVDLQQQVWAGSIASIGAIGSMGSSSGLDGGSSSSSSSQQSLRCNWESQNSAAYQDALGRCLLAVSMVAPAGMLVFFPSYGLLAKMHDRWRATGLLAELERWKRVFREPRAAEGGAEALEAALRGYLSEVRRGDAWTTPTATATAAATTAAAATDAALPPPPKLQTPQPHAPQTEFPNQQHFAAAAAAAPAPAATSTTTTIITTTTPAAIVATTPPRQALLQLPMKAEPQPPQPPQPERNGAVLLAVCRGKVSEGLDFRDDAARTVVVVGIPYPHWKDLKVTLKREHQTAVAAQQRTMRRQLAAMERQQQQQGGNGSGAAGDSGALHGSGSGGSSSSSGSSGISSSGGSSGGSDEGLALDGDEWYRQQAFRALNQAVGRCVRHRGDFGAVLLADPRFARRDVVDSLSRWLRPCVQARGSLAAALPSLRAFFAANERRRIRLPADPQADAAYHAAAAAAASSSFSFSFGTEDAVARAGGRKPPHGKRARGGATGHSGGGVGVGGGGGGGGGSGGAFSRRPAGAAAAGKENKKRGATGGGSGGGQKKKGGVASAAGVVTMTRFFKPTPEAAAAAEARAEREAVEAAKAAEAARDAARKKRNARAKKTRKETEEEKENQEPPPSAAAAAASRRKSNAKERASVKKEEPGARIHPVPVSSLSSSSSSSILDRSSSSGGAKTVAGHAASNSSSSSSSAVARTPTTTTVSPHTTAYGATAAATTTVSKPKKKKPPPLQVSAKKPKKKPRAATTTTTRTARPTIKAAAAVAAAAAANSSSDSDDDSDSDFDDDFL